MTATRRALRRVTRDQLATVRLDSSGYRGSERLVMLHNPALPLRGAVPMVYLHGLGGTGPSTLRSPGVRNLRFVAHAGTPVIAADFGGMATWANDDVVEAGGAIDDAIDYAAAQWGTESGTVVAAGESMGSWGAVAWAWRNVARVAAVWLVAPIVDAQAFYDANPGMQGSIDAAYGGAAAFQAARPTHDPGLNTAAFQPLGNVTRLDAAQNDELIDASIPVAWAAAAGVRRENMHVRPGGHVGPWTTVPGWDIAAWVASHTRTYRYL